jgi:chromosome segregation ATPase
MRLTNLKIERFRCHEGTEFRFAPGGNILFGQNFVGKSSVLDAIQFRLTGVCRGTDEAGRGAKSLTADGSPPRVDLEFEHSGTMPAKAILAAVLTPARFLELAPAKQQEIVMGLSGGFPENRWNIRSLEDLKSRHKEAVEKRREIKRTMTNTTPEPSVAEVDPAELEAAESRLQDLRRHRDELLKAIAAAEAGGPVVDVEKLKSEYRELESDIDADAEIHGRDIKAKAAAARKNVKGLERKLQTATNAKADVEKKAAEHRANLVELDRILTKLDGAIEGVQKLGSGECCLAPVPCSITDLQRGTILAEYTTDRKALVAKLAEVKKEAAAAARAVEMLNIGRIEADLKREQESLAKIEAAPEPPSLSGKRARLQDIGRQLLAAKAAPAAPVVDLTAAREELATIDGRIARGAEVIKAAGEAKVVWSAYRAHQDEQAKAEKRLAELEAEVASFAPDGDLAVQAQQQAQGGLDEIVATVMDAFGFDLQIGTAPWSITARGRDPELLSDSERIMASVAIQYALAKLTGVNVVLVDRLEAMDRIHRAALIRIIKHDQETQWIMAFTVPDEGYVPPEIPGITWIPVGVPAMAEVA